MTSQGALFRVTAAAETETTVDAAELIKFDEVPINTTAGRMLGTSVRMPRNINVHPTPNKALNQIEDGKLDFVEITVRGIVVSPSTNTTLGTLFNWQTQDADNADFTKGRFGYRSDKFPTFNLTPSAAIGYILTDVQFEMDYEFEDRLAITAVLRRNGSI
mgnify:CR=1 FL=1